jgi:hypothetical protein
MYESVDQLAAPDIWGNKKKRSSAMDIVIRQLAVIIILVHTAVGYQHWLLFRRGIPVRGP